jgi:hypothetical protein
MRIIYSASHHGHAPGGELNRGELAPAYECPRRVEEIRTAITRSGIGRVETPDSFVECAAGLRGVTFAMNMREPECR